MNPTPEEIRKQISEITNDPKYQTLITTPRDSYLERQLDVYKLRLATLNAMLGQPELVAAAPRRPPVKVNVQRQATRPAKVIEKPREPSPPKPANVRPTAAKPVRKNKVLPPVEEAPISVLIKADITDELTEAQRAEAARRPRTRKAAAAVKKSDKVAVRKEVSTTTDLTHVEADPDFDEL